MRWISCRIMPETPQGRSARRRPLRPDRVEAAAASTPTSSTRRPTGSRRSRSTGPRSATPSGRRPWSSSATRSTRARDDTEVGVDHLHRRRHQGLLLRRRPADPRRRRLHRRRRGRHAGRRPPRRQRPPRPDPAPAEAGGRDGRRLRDRRRPHPPPRLRPDDRRRQRPLRPDRPPGRQLRRRLRRRACCANSRRSRRRRRSGSSAACTTPSEALEMGLVNAVVPLEELEPRRSPGAARCSPSPPSHCACSSRASTPHEDGFTGIQQLAHDATLLFYMSRGGGQEGRNAFQEGRAARTSPSSRSGREDLADGGAAADAAGGDRAGAGRHRGGGRSGPASLPRVGAFVAALVGSIFIQIGTNLANDYSDAKRGADTADRLGPVRVTSAGLVTPRRVLRATWIAFGVAVACGIYLAVVAGIVILAGRRRLDRRRRPLHRRPAPLRLRRPRRGLRLPLLRPGRGQRLLLRPARGARRAAARALDRGRLPRHRDPRRQQRPRPRDRPPRRQEHAGGADGPRERGRALPAAGRSAPSWSCRSRCWAGEASALAADRAAGAAAGDRSRCGR